jgi:PadR family transcriptional regulator, regulatory protein PadR
MPSPTALPLVQGTLDLLVLRTLAAGPMHGYGIASLVDERTRGELVIEDAALYQALHRLDRQGLVDAEWRASDNNRRARYYTLTPAGRRRLREDTANWRRYTRAVEAVLAGT